MVEMIWKPAAFFVNCDSAHIYVGNFSFFNVSEQLTNRNVKVLTQL